MSITALLPDPAAIHLDYIRPSLSAITLIVRTTATHAECCRCHRTSGGVHSRYTRPVADLPWHGVSVKLEPHTRRFGRQNSLCTRRIFCDRVPSVVAYYPRKTVRLNDEQQPARVKLCQLFPPVEEAKESAQGLTRTVRGRSANKFNDWLRSEIQSRLKEFVSYARGLGEEQQAVTNALRYDWSNGQLEGQVNRLKLIKRMMNGRAKFDLLRVRVLHSAR